MTGFGASSRPWTDRDGSVLVGVELRSVNGRFLELKIRQPFGPPIEAEIRRRLEGRLGRGRVDASVFVRRESLAADVDPLGRFGVDAGRVAETLRALSAIDRAAIEENIELDGSSSLEVLKFMLASSRSSSEPTIAPEVVFEALDEALDELVAFRQREGEALLHVLEDLVHTLELQVRAIERTLPVERARLEARVCDLLNGWRALFGLEGAEADRITQEVALLLARGDVAEELARIASHLQQTRETLSAQTQRGQGKTLDFLSQELLREVTTIGSKITSHEGSRFVIEAKGTIERIREQVQNVE